MLQNTFGQNCMNQATVFERHKRFKEGRESVRDDERCRRSKKVNKPQLNGQIKNFMDNDRHVSIETISAQIDVSVGTVHRIIHKDLNMRKICREIVELNNSDSAVLDALVTSNESWIYCYDPETKRQSSQWKHAGFARQSKSTNKLLMILFLAALAWFTCTGFPLDRRSTRNTILRF